MDLVAKFQPVFIFNQTVILPGFYSTRLNALKPQNLCAFRMTMHKTRKPMIFLFLLPLSVCICTLAPNYLP